MDRTTILLGTLLAAFIVWQYWRMIKRSRDTKKMTALLNEGSATVVDVRTAAEFKTGHYPGAVNIPLEKLNKQTGRVGNPAKPTVVYCATGSRSRQAVRILKAAGFEQVMNGGSFSRLPKSG